MTSLRETKLLVRPLAGALLLASLPLGAAGIEVSVRKADGAPAAGATVCLGAGSDLSSYDLRTTDAQGRVRFASAPDGPFLVTASLGGRGIQQQRSGPPALGGSVPTISVVQLTLPSAPGGPQCPASRPGLLPPDLKDRVPTAPAPRAPIGPIVLKREFCFGALGMQCGQAQPPLPPTALCAAGSCLINAGSWKHDECCFANPNGMACRQGPLDAVTGHDGNCASEFEKAVRLSSKGIFWRRNVDFSQSNTSGQVIFSIYCAPAGTLLNPSDGSLCCSRSTRPLNASETARATAALESLVACR